MIDKILPLYESIESAYQTVKATLRTSEHKPPTEKIPPTLVSATIFGAMGCMPTLDTNVKKAIGATDGLRGWPNYPTA